MPVQSTRKGCWRWGKSGKVYCGKGAKKKAIKQGLAAGYKMGIIHISKHESPKSIKKRKRKKKKKS